ncbi:hypothetical protein Taro_024086, partial [Colocasia esculenta]|nr:hypothetical protein [Colocasia esculenta]
QIEKPLQRHGGRLEHNETYCGSCYGAEVVDRHGGLTSDAISTYTKELASRPTRTQVQGINHAKNR